MLVLLYGTLRGESGVRQVSVALPAGASAREVVDEAIAQRPSLRSLLYTGSGELREDILVLRNGRNIRLIDGWSTPLQPGDKLALFPQTGIQRAFAQD